VWRSAFVASRIGKLTSASSVESPTCRAHEC
jgi:hypothetical protein